MNITRTMLVALTVLFLHYGPVLYWAGQVARVNPADAPLYLQLSPVIDAFLELGLAFGMVVLSTERVHEELDEKNQALAALTGQLAHAARTDALTGLLNRRGYEELLAEKAGEPFPGSLVVLDLNNLKPLNDRYGHPAGDAALQLVARALRVHFRVTDPIFRTGGDEFLVVLPGGPVPDVAERMGRIDEALRAQRLPGVPTPVDLTVAWGLAEFATGDGLTAAVGKADAAMYAQKQARKNAGEGASASSSDSDSDEGVTR
jgi:diguanylate cyclase (GGDEF)-like protein